MLESLFVRIVITMVFPFISTAYMTDRALRRRFPFPMTVLMWAVAFIPLSRVLPKRISPMISRTEGQMGQNNVRISFRG